MPRDQVSHGLSGRQRLARLAFNQAEHKQGDAEDSDQAGDAALLVPPGDVPALAAAIDRPCTDDDLAHCLSERGRGRAARFSVERMRAAALGLYQELIEGHEG
ncbi:MAG: hypothetical protein HY332_15710 [Chloroflexi bacterium]|nr:hypothetical protein [Chloroflexota bacterium]